MDRNKRKIIMYIFAIAIVTMGVAYATLSATLNIGGTSTIGSGAWKIYFDNLSEATLTGEASVESASLESTSISINGKVVLPLDSIMYTFDVVNDGGYDAIVDTISLKGESLAETYNLTYTFTYEDGTEIKVGDLLESRQSKKLKLMISYDDVNSLPSNDVNLELGATLIYAQVVGEGSGGGSGDDSGNTGNTYKDPILAGSDPNLLNNSLVPVVYNGSNWVVADTTQKWYNYAEQEWANAVILENGVTKNVGDTVIVPTATSTTTEVKAMYVWIPRYEYKIEGEYGTHTDGTAGTAELPGAIDIRFISTSTTSATSGYRIHPAFTWDNDNNGTIANNEHISGIWVGKFEPTGTASTPTVLPNLVSLREQNVSTQFETAQKFGTYLTNSTNVDSHMMKNSEWGAVAYLSQSIYGKYGNDDYTGANKEVYPNYNHDYEFYTGRGSAAPWLPDNTYDVTAGIETIFSGESDFVDYSLEDIINEGLQYNEGVSIDGNVLSGDGGTINFGYSGYVDDYLLFNVLSGEVIVYLWDYDYYLFAKAGESVYVKGNEWWYTGIVIIVSGEVSGELCYEGYCDRDYVISTELGGTGASTTGNIYGVYDMSGGAAEFVMGVYNNTIGNSGFTTLPERKYYDNYTDTDMAIGCNGGICYGHALSETSDWYWDTWEFIDSSYSWLMRGGEIGCSDVVGVFTVFGEGWTCSYSSSFRSVLLSTGA